VAPKYLGSFVKQAWQDAVPDAQQFRRNELPLARQARPAAVSDQWEFIVVVRCCIDEISSLQAC
jgi:hypothetical protein